MQRVVVAMPINDYERAVAFWVEGLGFSIEFEHRHEPGFPVFMGIKSGDLYLHLNEHAKPGAAAEVTLYVDDIDDWYGRAQKTDAVLDGPPVRQPWGDTECSLVDPFGNTLRLSQMGTHGGAPTPNRSA